MIAFLIIGVEKITLLNIYIYIKQSAHVEGPRLSQSKDQRNLCTMPPKWAFCERVLAAGKSGSKEDSCYYSEGKKK